MRITTALFVGVSLLQSTAAGAAAPHFIIDSWGVEGSGPGALDLATDLDVDGQGNVYVVDHDNQRIQKFDQTGRFMLSWNGGGRFENLGGIAVTPAGYSWVTDRGRDVVEKFGPNGNRIFTSDILTGTGGNPIPTAVAVGPTEDAFILDIFSKGIYKFLSSGEFRVYWPLYTLTSPRDLAIDSAGDMLVLDSSSRSVYRFSSRGSLLTVWPVTRANGTSVPLLSAIDVSDTGDVYVLSREYGAEAIYRYTSGGTFLSRSALTPVDPVTPAALAVDWTDNLWVSNAGAPCVVRLAPPPAATHILQSASVPGYLFEVRIVQGPDRSIYGSKERVCIPETLCVSGAVPGRAEAFLRVVGPKPNGKMWPTLVKFSTSTVEVWVQQASTGQLRYYRLPGASPGVDELPGMFDRLGYDP